MNVHWCVSRLETDTYFVPRTAEDRRISSVSKSTPWIYNSYYGRACGVATREPWRITSLGNNDARGPDLRIAKYQEPRRVRAGRAWFIPANLINHRLIAIGIESSPPSRPAYPSFSCFAPQRAFLSTRTKCQRPRSAKMQFDRQVLTNWGKLCIYIRALWSFARNSRNILYCK